MPRGSHLKISLLNNADPKSFSRSCVSCLVLNKEGKIVLQQRDNDSPTFPGRLATFGGGIERGESSLQALTRELKEELGAEVKIRDVIYLGMLTEEETNHSELVYLYYWHDRLGSITGCYEGSAQYYNNMREAESHPKIMEDVKWLLHECKKRKLLL